MSRTMTVVEAEPATAPSPISQHATDLGTWGRLRDGVGRVPRDRVARAVLVALLVALAVLSVWNITESSAFQDDEGTYTSQAFSVLEDGELAPYTYWYDHPPLGWIQLGLLVWLPQLLGLGGDTHVGAARMVIAPFFAATAVLIYLIARRMEVRRPPAVVAAALFALSPLALTIGRQVYLDNIGVAWLLLAYYLVLSPRNALWHHIGAGVFFAVAVLSKETLAIFGPSLLLALLNRPSWSNRAFSVVGFLVVGGAALALYPLMALLRGEFFSGPGHVSLQDALVYQFLTRSGSGSIWEAGSSRAELLQGWLFYDRPLVVVGLVAAVLCLVQRRSMWIPVGIAFFALPIVTGEGYLPAMYIIGVLPFLALAVGCALNMAWGRLERVADLQAPSVRRAVRAAGAVTVAFVLLVTVAPQWVGQNRTLLTHQTNQDWSSALAWAEDNIPRDDTVLAPYSMWQDLSASGWSDAWSVVATEKADLDPEFLNQHPEGADAIDWVLVGPFVESNIDQLGLTTAGEALENSVPVQTFGGWSIHRVLND
ncbi:ArnT family glycosyltransferase [Kocuria sabuli]|uniref:ArnT family glycosyltransferase n=1 Tax=Kocuria sabuli TaxID=3071448 RepID=UPI0034D49E19